MFNSLVFKPLKSMQLYSYIVIMVAYEVFCLLLSEFCLYIATLIIIIVIVVILPLLGSCHVASDTKINRSSFLTIK